MDLAYSIRVSRTLFRHPVQSAERVRGRIDARGDKRALAARGLPPNAAHGPVTEWEPPLRRMLGLCGPSGPAAGFNRLWTEIGSDLRDAGVRFGLATYRGWNDGDRAFAGAISCITAHIRPTIVVETGVAHGVTSRVILETLERNGHGTLWSIDLPAVDSDLHPDIGVAVPARLRSRWTYAAGTSRQHLPALLARLGQVDLFVHDSLHTGRNVRFELGRVWPALRPGGIVLVDDVDRNTEFSSFLRSADVAAWFVGHHVTGPGLWGVAKKAAGPAPKAHDDDPDARVARRPA
jgi:Methyltransferase domain